MIHKLFAVRDRAADAYGRPFASAAIGLAVRDFNAAINDKQNQAMNNHPDDFDLYEIGIFDDNTGEIVGQQPKQIAIGKNQIVNE